MHVLVTIGACDFVLAKGMVLHVSTRRCDSQDRVRTLVRRWMRKRASELLRARFCEARPFAQRLGIELPALALRSMKRAWANRSSCGKRVSLNPRLIAVPPVCIDYVILRELCAIATGRTPGAHQVWMSEIMPAWQTHHDTLARFDQARTPLRVARRARIRPGRHGPH